MWSAWADLADSQIAYRWATLSSWACFAGDSLRKKNKSFDLGQNHSLYHQTFEHFFISFLEV